MFMTSLAREMNIPLRSIQRYCYLARNLKDFMEDYPVYNGKVVTNCALTTYQCWVIVQIKALYACGRGFTKDILETMFISQTGIATNLSRQEYERIYPRYTKDASEATKNDSSELVLRLVA